jgi:hypothetical protein
MRRHTFDPISFILGALFAAIGLTFLFGDADIGDFHLAVVWPLPLIVIGLLMLITTIQRRTPSEELSAAAPPPVSSGAAATAPTAATSGPIHNDDEPRPTEDLLDDSELDGSPDLDERR